MGMEPAHITSDGWRHPVYIDGVALDLRPSLKLANHSPTGFAWGYAGSGPAQLALAILLRFTDGHTALRLHQEFKFDHVARWNGGEALDERVDVVGWLADHERWGRGGSGA